MCWPNVASPRLNYLIALHLELVPNHRIHKLDLEHRHKREELQGKVSNFSISPEDRL